MTSHAARVISYPGLNIDTILRFMLRRTPHHSMLYMDMILLLLSALDLSLQKSLPWNNS